jgi:hypothetical protein
MVLVRFLLARKNCYRRDMSNDTVLFALLCSSRFFFGAGTGKGTLTLKGIDSGPTVHSTLRRYHASRPEQKLPKSSDWLARQVARLLMCAPSLLYLGSCKEGFRLF